jgi:hypothetical protein
VSLWWGGLLEVSQEVSQTAGFAFHFEGDITGSIAYPAPQSAFLSQLIDEGPEAHTLNHSPDFYL